MLRSIVSHSALPQDSWQPTPVAGLEYRPNAPLRALLIAARGCSGSLLVDDRQFCSLLFRPVIAERRVALVELRLNAAAVTAERAHVGLARFGREGQRLDLGAGADGGACAH